MYQVKRSSTINKAATGLYTVLGTNLSTGRPIRTCNEMIKIGLKKKRNITENIQNNIKTDGCNIWEILEI